MENATQESIIVSGNKNYQRPKFIKWFYIINILLLVSITFIPVIMVFAYIDIYFAKIVTAVISVKYWLIPLEFSIVVGILLCELILFIKKQKNNLASALLFFCIQVILVYFVMFLYGEVFGVSGGDVPTPALPVAPKVY